MSLFCSFWVALLVFAAVLEPSEAEDAQKRKFSVGSDATLQCSWSGLEDQNLINLVRWFRRGQRLRSKKYTFEKITHSGSNVVNYTVTINNIQKKDKGAYTCTPRLDIDMTLAEGKFEVEVVDVVLTQAPNITDTQLVERGSGSLNCNYKVAKTQHDLMVYWSRDGIKLMGESGNVGEDTEATYQTYTDEYGIDWMNITNADVETAGVYSCNYEYKDGQVFTMSFNLTVAPTEAPKFQEVQLVESGSGSLNCNFKVAKTKHDLIVYWSRDGIKLMEESGNVGEDTEATYQTYTDENGIDWINVTNVDVETAGVYSCNYQYQDGRVFTMSFNLTVKELDPPKDVVRNITMREDFETGTLICNVSSLRSQMERFYWEKDGVELMDGEKYSIRETDDHFHTLKVNMLKAEEDTGVYRCVAQLNIYPLAIRFNVTVVKSTKNTDFAEWTVFSVCDKQGKKYRFRVCAGEQCFKYGYVYEVDSEVCKNMEVE